MTLTDDDLYSADAVEIRFRAADDADRAVRRPGIGDVLRDAVAGHVARVRPGLVHELRSHLQAMGIEHEERAAQAA
jgi:pantoate kinase